jgi:hypothetical protein
LKRTHNSEQNLNENLGNTAKANPVEIIAGVLKASGQPNDPALVADLGEKAPGEPARKAKS